MIILAPVYIHVRGPTVVCVSRVFELKSAATFRYPHVLVPNQLLLAHILTPSSIHYFFRSYHPL